jgi:hypothetical protein
MERTAAVRLRIAQCPGGFLENDLRPALGVQNAQRNCRLTAIALVLVEGDGNMAAAAI